MKKLGDLVNPALVRQAELLTAMNAAARSRLPKEMASHCWVGGYEKKHLLLITDSSSYVLYIRCHQREILKQLKEEFNAYLPKDINRVRIKVARILADA